MKTKIKSFIYALLVVLVVGYFSPIEHGYIMESTHIPFNTDNQNISLSGFYNAEKWGRWTQGKEATISFELLDAVDTKVSLDTWFFINNQHPELMYSIWVNDKLYTKEVVTKNHSINLDIVKEDIPASGMVVVRFDIENPGNPAKLGASEDKRDLGIAVNSMDIEIVPITYSELKQFAKTYNLWALGSLLIGLWFVFYVLLRRK